jgi:hypothetical protein
MCVNYRMVDPIWGTIEIIKPELTISAAN